MLYAFSTQESSDSFAPWNERTMFGNAIATTVSSTNAMNKPIDATASTTPGRARACCTIGLRTAPRPEAPLPDSMLILLVISLPLRGGS
jgi:hypothetical protein